MQKLGGQEATLPALPETIGLGSPMEALCPPQMFPL